MVIVIAVDENNIIKRVDIPLSDEHFEAILKNNQNLVPVETDLNLDEVKLIGNYKLEDNRLVELPANEKLPEVKPESELEQLRQSLLATQKFMIDFYTEMLMSIE